MAPPQKAQGGNLLTRKIGPLPGWGWLAVALVAYYLYKKTTGGGGSTTTSTAGTTPPVATITLPGGYSYSGPASGAASFQQAAQAPASSPGQGTTGTSPGSGAGTPGTAQSGFTPIANPTALGQYFAAGGTPYVSLYGNYVPYQAAPANQPQGGYAPGTTVYAGPALPNQGQK